MPLGGQGVQPPPVVVMDASIDLPDAAGAAFATALAVGFSVAWIAERRNSSRIEAALAEVSVAFAWCLILPLVSLGGESQTSDLTGWPRAPPGGATVRLDLSVH